MPGPADPVSIASVGPPEDRPCGIGDYRLRLEAELSGRCALVAATYEQALVDPRVAACRALLVHYERSLVPGPGYLEALARRHPGKVFVAPHEVYAEDPFAFPYGKLASDFPPLLWLKRLRYRWAHRDYARERALQQAAYHAHRVIPLSREGGDILRGLVRGAGAAERILEPIPIARVDPPAAGTFRAAASSRRTGIEGRTRALIGVFGFLNPGLDYGAAFDLVAGLGGDLGLLILGGDRRGYPMRAGLEAEIRARGLERLVEITGYLPEEELAGRMAECDLFLSPMRFKSSSASVLQLFGTGKAILAPDLPLTRWLRDQGAPLDLYADAEDLLDKARGYLEGRRKPPEDRYPWSLGAVAEAYLRAMGAAAGGGAGPVSPQ